MVKILFNNVSCVKFQGDAPALFGGVVRIPKRCVLKRYTWQELL